MKLELNLVFSTTSLQDSIRKRMLKLSADYEISLEEISFSSDRPIVSCVLDADDASTADAFFQSAKNCFSDAIQLEFSKRLTELDDADEVSSSSDGGLEEGSVSLPRMLAPARFASDGSSFPLAGLIARRGPPTRRGSARARVASARGTRRSSVFRPAFSAAAVPTLVSADDMPTSGLKKRARRGSKEALLEAPSSSLKASQLQTTRQERMRAEVTRVSASSVALMPYPKGPAEPPAFGKKELAALVQTEIVEPDLADLPDAVANKLARRR